MLSAAAVAGLRVVLVAAAGCAGAGAEATIAGVAFVR